MMPEDKTEREQFIHSKLRYVTRRYLSSGGREPVPDRSVFVQKMLESLQSKGAEGILTIDDIYQHMQRLSPQPHQNGFGKNEAWSAFLFVASQR